MNSPKKKIKSLRLETRNLQVADFVLRICFGLLIYYLGFGAKYVV